MKRTSFAKDQCPVARSAETVGDWWSLLILTVRLKKLVADGVLEFLPASDGTTIGGVAPGRPTPR